MLRHMKRRDEGIRAVGERVDGENFSNIGHFLTGLPTSIHTLVPPRTFTASTLAVRSASVAWTLRRSLWQITLAPLTPRITWSKC